MSSVNLVKDIIEKDGYEKDGVFREYLHLKSSCGLVRKVDLREKTLKAEPYEYKLALDFMSEEDEQFKNDYEKYHLKHSIPEELALRFIRHMMPSYKVRINFGEAI